VYRPFPRAELIEAVRRAKVVVVFDKSLSYGHEGPIGADVKSVLFGVDSAPAVHGYVAGLGGRDIKAHELAEAAKESLRLFDAGMRVRATTWLNCQI
jgi:pyruvate ferredoxin oxidoreductase alpha subunit